MAESPVRADLDEVLQGQSFMYKGIFLVHTQTLTHTHAQREIGRTGGKKGREGIEEGKKECNSIFNLRILTLLHISRVISIACRV